MSTRSSFPRTLSALPSEPLVSVLMTSYNYERYIEKAIQSVVNQTYQQWELVICDDGSTDESRSIARRFADKYKRIKLVEQENAGVSVALNSAFSTSQGEIVCLLDADDVFASNKLLEVVSRCKERHQAGLILHGMQVVDEKGDVLYELPRSGRFEEGWLAQDITRRGGRWRSMPASALCFRRQIADMLFPLPFETLQSMADAYLYMLAPLLTEVSYIPVPLADYRLHGSNMTGTLQFDVHSAEKFMHGMEQVHKSIETKVCPDLFDEMPLQLTQHLTYQEQLFLKSLFNGSNPSELLMGYSRLLRMINKDDLYGASRKWMGLVANGVAIGLPVSWRPAWITWVMGAKWRKWFGK